MSAIAMPASMTSSRSNCWRGPRRGVGTVVPWWRHSRRTCARTSERGPCPIVLTVYRVRFSVVEEAFMATAQLHDGESIEVTCLGDGPAILLPVSTAVVEGKAADQMRAWG